jgi:hypothetical protein
MRDCMVVLQARMYLSVCMSVFKRVSDVTGIGMWIGVLYFCVVLVGNFIGGRLLIAMNGQFWGCNCALGSDWGLGLGLFCWVELDSKSA